MDVPKSYLNHLSLLFVVMHENKNCRKQIFLGNVEVLISEVNLNKGIQWYNVVDPLNEDTRVSHFYVVEHNKNLMQFHILELHTKFIKFDGTL